MEMSIQKTAAILGLEQSISTDLDLALAIERGFPISAFDHVVKLIAPKEPSFAFKIIPRSTLMRYKNDRRKLSLKQSDSVARLARIWAIANSVWKSQGATRRFLFEGHQLLGGKRPIDIALRTAVGARMVEDILGRLEHGSVS
jgi:putative toxin-antitoxin system antitoxin component (TIGR02293 family)